VVGDNSTFNNQRPTELRVADSVLPPWTWGVVVEYTRVWFVDCAQARGLSKAWFALDVAMRAPPRRARPALYTQVLLDKYSSIT